MIRAIFEKKDNCLVSVDMTGHAGFADSGKDILCAAASSALMTAVNGITECAGIEGITEVSDNRVFFKTSPSREAHIFLDALRLQLCNIEEQYRGTVKVIITEV